MPNYSLPRFGEGSLVERNQGFLSLASFQSNCKQSFPRPIMEAFAFKHGREKGERLNRNGYSKFGDGIRYKSENIGKRFLVPCVKVPRLMSGP